MEAGLKRGAGLSPRRKSVRPLALIATVCLFVPGLLFSQEAGALPLRPGEPHPLPRQRALTDILDMPAHKVVCPADGYEILVPDVDKLMRRTPGVKDPARWQMDAASRDADLCPHPGPGMIDYQADLIVCPSCGLSAPESFFAESLPQSSRAWIIDTFRADMLQTQRLLLGQRGGEMSDKEIADFFNRQSEIPDVVRTEHNRIRTLAGRDPAPKRAEATWLAAWAARRAICRPPQGDFLGKRAKAVVTAMGDVKRRERGVEGELKTLTHLLGKTSSGKERLNVGERIAARLMLAGVKSRIGLNAEAERDLEALHAFCRDRFAQPEQDPLWQHTSGKQSKERRRQEVEAIRSECEAEIAVRLDLLRRQDTLLREAAGLIREAILTGGFNNRPDELMFHVYLAGEFFRRSGNLPLAAEWLKLVRSLVPEEQPLDTAARLQLEAIKIQADDKVNLLSAIGQDAEAFERVRDIYRTTVTARP